MTHFDCNLGESKLQILLQTMVNYLDINHIKNIYV